MRALLWRVATWLPVAAAFHELVLGVVPSRGVANARACALGGGGGAAGDNGGGGDSLLLVARQARAARGALILFAAPAPGAAPSLGVVRAAPGDTLVAPRGGAPPRRLESGQLWVEVPGGGEDGGALDSRDFGPLPLALVRGVPVAEVGAFGLRWL